MPCPSSSISILLSNSSCLLSLVNILTLVALYRLAVRTQKALYVYLLALTGSDILSQLFIIFVGFLLETAVFHRDVPVLLLRSVSMMEFSANHASIWATVPLTVDRYVALCHPLSTGRSVTRTGPANHCSGVHIGAGIRRAILLVVGHVEGQPCAKQLGYRLDLDPCDYYYFLPCCIFLVLNSLIILRLRKRQRQQIVPR